MFFNARRAILSTNVPIHPIKIASGGRLHRLHSTFGLQISPQLMETRTHPGA